MADDSSSDRNKKIEAAIVNVFLTLYLIGLVSTGINTSHWKLDWWNAPPKGAAVSTPVAPVSAQRLCDSNYSPCVVPLVPYDLDCADVGHRVLVVGVDIHRLDGDGNGIGCENYPW